MVSTTALGVAFLLSYMEFLKVAGERVNKLLKKTQRGYFLRDFPEPCRNRLRIWAICCHRKADLLLYAVIPIAALVLGAGVYAKAADEAAKFLQAHP